MKSPVPDLAPSDGEEGEDRTPLLQRAPRAETGEQLREPGALGGRRSQGRGCPELLKREGTENGEPIQDPTQPPPSRVPKKQLWGPGGGLDREAGPGRAEARAGSLQVPPRGPRQVQPRGPRQVQPRGPRQVQPAGPGGELLGAGGAGLPAIFGSVEPGTLWKNELGENLEINGQRAEGRTP